MFGAPLAVGLDVSAEISPELLGVGYIIGPRIASTIAAGGVLAYHRPDPDDTLFRRGHARHLGALEPRPSRACRPDDIRGAYVLYIGAGAVATGGIVSASSAPCR